MVRTIETLARRGGDVDELFKALADPSRRKMLSLLARHELPLKGIERQFRMSRPAVIKHLRALRACRLVLVRKRGRETIHSLDPTRLRAVKDWLARLELRWDDHLYRLQQQVESDP